MDVPKEVALAMAQVDVLAHVTGLVESSSGIGARQAALREGAVTLTNDLLLEAVYGALGRIGQRLQDLELPFAWWDTDFPDQPRYGGMTVDARFTCYDVSERGWLVATGKPEDFRPIESELLYGFLVGPNL